MTQLHTLKLFSFFTESRFLICFVFLPIFIYAQPVSQTFNASGTYTIPNGYSANINVQVWGAGGGGGYSAGNGNGGGGGGGGECGGGGEGEGEGQQHDCVGD